MSIVFIDFVNNVNIIIGIVGMNNLFKHHNNNRDRQVTTLYLVGDDGSDKSAIY